MRTSCQRAGVYCRKRANPTLWLPAPPFSSSEIQADPGIGLGKIARIVADQSVRRAESELEILARALDELRIERHEPFLADIVIGNRILVADAQGPSAPQRFADGGIEIEPAYLPGTVLACVEAHEVARLRRNAQP